MTAEQQSFINIIGTACLQHYAQYKVLPSLTIAQIIKESNWGKSGLSKTCYNYTGMKWTAGCGYAYKEYNTKEWDKTTSQYITIKAKFIKFSSPAEGIEGHYKFIHKYKRYKSIIGETDAKTACTKMGNSGWATAPNYGAGLWSLVTTYKLVTWDNLALNGVVGDTATTNTAQTVTEALKGYRVGNVYTLNVNLNVRDSANGTQLKYDALTVDAKKNAIFDNYGRAVLKKGTKVTCKAVKELDTSTWLQIPSGWVCAKSKDKVYINE